MELKYFIIFAAIKYSTCTGGHGQLRKTPKVYNALITTDDNLQSSRAYPVIQPTIHETGIAHYPFGAFNEYRYFSPPLIHTGPQGYHPSEQESTIRLQGSPSQPSFTQFPPQIPFPQGQPNINELENSQYFGEFSTQEYGHFPQWQPGFTAQGFPQSPQGQPGFPPQLRPSNIQSPQENLLASDKKSDQNSPSTKHTQLTKPGDQQNQELPVIPTSQRPLQPASIPLNPFGYPPSLIPLQTFYHPAQQNEPENRINLQPYPFNNYPLIADQLNPFPPQFHQGNYLPPFNSYPDTFGVYQLPKKPKKNLRKPSNVATPTTMPKSIESDIRADSIDDQNITRNQNNANEINLSENATTLGDFVKNGASNLNSDVPDVASPPVPAGNVQN